MTKTSVRNFTILFGGTMTVMASAILAPALPGMAVAFADVPHSELLVRLTLTIPAFFIVIGAPVAGILLDRWGRKPVIISSLIIYGLAGPAGFFLNSLTAILVSRAVLGVAVAGIMSGFTTLIADYFSGAKLVKFMGYQAAFLGLGGVLYLLLGGFLADVGWRWPFLIHLLVLAVLPGTLFAVSEPAAVVKKKAKVALMTMLAPIRNTVGLIYGLALAGMMIFFTIPVNIAFYLTAETGISGSKVGLALALQALVTVFVALQYKRIKARLSFQTIFALIFFVFGVNLIILSSTAAYGPVLVGLLIGGLGLGLMPVNVNVWLTSIVPAAVRGRAVGGLTAALFLGQFLAPLITQPLVERTNLATMFGIISVVAFLLSAILVLTNRTKKISLQG